MGFKENTEKELKDLEQMVQNWRNYYIGEIDPNHSDYNKTLIEDLTEEISMYIMPYIKNIKRFPENKLDETKERTFYKNIAKYVDDLVWEIGKKEKCEEDIIKILDNEK